MVDLWILTHRRVGDLQQMRTLAAALPAQVTEKRIVFRLPRLAATMPFLSLQLVDRRRSSPIMPPWPDLVLVAEGAVGSVALDIKRQSANRTKIVCLGRPRGRMTEFDLIITSPQFRLPTAANVVELTLPLHRLDQEAMGKAAALVAPKLSALPRPWITLLVGGTSTPDVLDGATASDLARKALTYAEERKGSLIVVTSPRTGRKAEGALAETLDGLAHIYLWSRDADTNHYLGYLQLADSFIVTSDSISMIAEAIHTGKPVDVFNLPQRTTWLQSAINWLHKRNRWTISRVLFDSGLIEVRTNRHLLLDELRKQGLLSSRHTRADGRGNTQIQAVKTRVLELIYGRNSGKFVSS